MLPLILLGQLKGLMEKGQKSRFGLRIQFSLACRLDIAIETQVCVYFMV